MPSNLCRLGVLKATASGLPWTVTRRRRGLLDRERAQ
jgi:hypothetical protein